MHIPASSYAQRDCHAGKCSRALAGCQAAGGAAVDGSGVIIAGTVAQYLFGSVLPLHGYLTPTIPATFCGL
jgi:hypothetical protein